MPTKQFSFRISEVAYDFIAKEARHEGVSVAQFVRETAFARAWFQMAVRDEVPEGTWEALRIGREKTRLD